MEVQNSFIGVRRYFTKQEKLQILKEHKEQGIPISQLARKNGTSAVNIYQWKRLMNEEDESITPEKIRELLLENSKLKTDIKHLKCKVADLAVSNDILTDAIDIIKKRDLLKQAQLQEKLKNQKSTK
jgi:transposase-like protein